MSHGSTKGVPIDTDASLTANSDLLVPSQKAVRTHVATAVTNGTASLAASGHTHLGLFPNLRVTGEYALLSQLIGAGGYAAISPAASATNSNNLVIYQAFPVTEALAIAGLAIYQVAANAGGSANLRMGILADNGAGRPGVVIAQESTTQSAALREITFAQTANLTPGYYWAFLAAQNMDTAGTNPTFAGVNASFGVPSAPETAPAASNNMFPYLLTTSVSGALTDNPSASITRSLNPKIFHFWAKWG